MHVLKKRDVYSPKGISGRCGTGPSNNQRNVAVKVEDNINRMAFQFF